MRSLSLKLDPGADLRKSIEEIGLTSKTSGFILGVVGNLSRACFQCPGKADPTVLEGNLEIITLNGTFSEHGVHLHLSLSDGDCQVWGGHLELGTLVFKGADILLGVVDKDENASNISSSTQIGNNVRIHIATLNNCPWSARALRILKSSGLPYTIQIIDTEDDFKALNHKTGITKFPQIFIDGEFIGGYQALSELYNSGKLIKL